MDYSLIFGLLAVFLAGLNRGFTGFGSGLVLVPILSMIYNPLFAVVVVTILELIPSIQLLPNSIKHCQWRSVLPMALTGLVTVPVGVSLLAITNEQVMKLFIAILILLSVSILYFKPGNSTHTPIRKQSSFFKKQVVTAGGLSGLLSGATGLGGVPVILYYLSSHTAAVCVRSSMIVFLSITSLISFLTFLFKDLITNQIVTFSILVLPVFVIAIWLGGKMFNRASEQSFRNFTLVLLACIGLFMMIQTLNN